MLYGYFYFSPYIGGEEIKFLNNYRLFNKCPKCKEGFVFEGLIKLRQKCSVCKVKFNSEKIGDAASWITTSTLCFFLIPILFFYEIQVGIEIKFYIIIVLPILSIFCLVFLRLSRYLLLKKYYELK